MKIEITIPDTNIKTCKHCDERFVAGRKDKLYCTHSCRQQAYIARQAIALNASSLRTDLNNTQKKDGLIKRLLKLLW